MSNNHRRIAAIATCIMLGSGGIALGTISTSPYLSLIGYAGGLFFLLAATGLWKQRPRKR